MEDLDVNNANVQGNPLKKGFEEKMDNLICMLDANPKILSAEGEIKLMVNLWNDSQVEVKDLITFYKEKFLSF